MSNANYEPAFSPPRRTGTSSSIESAGSTESRTAKRSFECRICKKPFPRKFNCERHEQSGCSSVSVHLKQRYQCPSHGCRTSCSRKDHLKAHVNKKHADKRHLLMEIDRNYPNGESFLGASMAISTPQELTAEQYLPIAYPGDGIAYPVTNASYGLQEAPVQAMGYNYLQNHVIMAPVDSFYGPPY